MTALTSSFGIDMSKRRVLVLGFLPALVIAILFALPSGSSALPPMPPEGMQCANTGPTISLETATGHVYTPDGNSIYMWGYRLPGDAFQAPGPVLCVNQGDTVSITLTNNLSEPASMIFPGQTGVSASGGSAGLLTNEAAGGGGSVTYEFEASEPGTYIYESGTDMAKQTQMGLYGALIVRPTMGASYAYNDAATKFSREYLILINEIDPDQHRAVELGQSYDDTKFNDDYWHINGRSFPDTIAANGASWLPNQPYGALVRVQPGEADPILVRYANVGRVNHPLHPHGNHMRVIARDGRRLVGAGGEDISYENFTRTIGSGQTYDLLFRWDVADAWITGSNGPAGFTMPNLQNLVFKDGLTWYSGDPNLGQKGPLPQGVTSNNQCGEYYFPWHSHALNEFTNFDEGFGGLATLLRVDKAGGCP